MSKNSMNTYITTPIYYVNAEPHLGHAYTTIVADTYSRFCRLCGNNVRFQTGTDEHGDKIAEAAGREGIGPKAYVDRISALFRDTWPQLQIFPDTFIRTTDRDHIKTVQDILQKVYDQGDIYFDEYSGLYCKGCERFLTEKELVNGNCPDHQVPPREITEQNYFFRMSKYQQQLIDYIHTHPEFITPERYRNEVLSFLQEPLEDLCISRPTSRLTWGIRLPFDESFVTYVWFDALINYLTGIGYPDGEDYTRYWPVAEHLIAKDILKPHAIYWPTMLMAIGLPLFTRLHVHGYWNVDETKMSKSIGNVVRPGDLVAEYGSDTIRYFTLREMSFGLDASFGHDTIIARKNSDLANDLGNLFSRSTAMLMKYTGGLVPRSGPLVPADEELQLVASVMLSRYRETFSNFQFHLGLQSVWEFVSHANKYIVRNEPWALAADPGKTDRLHTVLYNLAECLRLLTLVLSPVMPQTAEKMVAGLGFAAGDPRVASLEQGGVWGLTPPGIKLQKIEVLFPRIEKIKPEEVAAKKPAVQKGQREEDGLITFEQFQAVDLRVAVVVAAERIAKSEKLLKLTVKVPEERTVVAGLAEFYSPEEMVGRRVLMVANLRPARLMGIESQGMLLAAKTEVDGKQRLFLAAVNERVAAGSKVS
ncbi:MAG: methionine--tRNA ligase [Desulfocapsaceae bacterium]|nr:methionine--tRNA ligase [Desulfocapsaceae bacterium]